jgi:serine/threonine protein kinase
MGLLPFTKLGPYEIAAPLGAGGMGEVYRARDTRLGRNVAIKVLSAGFAADADRMRRFEQEARAAGMLNHPNILAVYDVGTHEGLPYLVTELLEGETLRDAGVLPRRKAVDYAQQLARGLAAAHEKGITHRDLKPENIFVTRDEHIKILDFGLAKLTEREPETPAVITTTSITTEPGTVMGTVGYMSPEQVRGEPADYRADIFSFGAILYEMVSGQRAFGGHSSIENMHAILKSDPPELPDPAIERIVRRCLEKRPERRFQSASDLAFAIAHQSDPGSGSIALAAKPVMWHKSAAWYSVALALLIGIASGIWWHARRTPVPRLWTGQQLGGSNIALHPRVSPDGRTLAFVTLVDGQRELAITQPGSLNWTVLTHEKGRGSVINLCWARDGARIYFDRGDSLPRGIYSVPALGGEEHLVLEDAAVPEVLPDGSLLVLRVVQGGAFRLHRHRPETGQVEPLNAFTFNEVRSFPDGKHAVFYGYPSGDDPTMGFYALDLSSGRSRRLAAGLKTGLEGLAPTGYSTVSLAMERDGRAFLTVIRREDLYRVVRVPRDEGSLETLFSLSVRPGTLDIALDGSIYLDQPENRREVLRFPVAGGAAERLASPRGLLDAIPLPDNRILLDVQIAGRHRLLLARPGHDPSPFVDTEEETSAPMTMLGDREVAFLAGSGPNRTVAIASIADSRINRRVASTKGIDLKYLSASPNGRTLYYSLFTPGHGTVWSLPAAGGPPQKLVDAAMGTPDPRGTELLLERWDKDTVTLSKLPLTGGPETIIPVRSPAGLLGDIFPGAMDKSGRILTTVYSRDSAFTSLGILDSKTGKLERIPFRYDGNFLTGTWTADGRIFGIGEEMHAAIWRFQRESKQ